MEQTKSKNSVWSSLIVGLKLLLICAIIAGVVSFVYSLTKETYAQNKQAEEAAAIGVIFGFDDESPVTKALSENDITTVYSVMDADGKTLVGYCVKVIEHSGYGGDVTMMVGYDKELKICGIEVVSHSETPGLGSKIEGAEFREQFFGVSDTVKYEDVDGVSGATYSSKAVTAGVNKATAALQAAIKSEGGAVNE